jgi:hypothetical protein
MCTLHRLHPPICFVAQPTNNSPHSFEAKLRNCHGDFMGQITKPQLSVLRPKPGNPREWFWGQTRRTIATGFEVKTGDIIATSFDAKPGETVDLGFEAKPRNSHPSSPYSRCRPYTASPDLSIVRPLSTRLVLDYPWSSAPSPLLLPRSSSLPAMPYLSPAHHETSKCVSPQKSVSRVQPPKYPYLNSNYGKSMTHHNQTKVLTTWFLNLPLDEYIDNKKHKVWILNPRYMKHS